MNHHRSTQPALGALALALGATLQGQSTAVSGAAAAAPPAANPAAAASAGLANDWLRTQDPFFKAWDLGGQYRQRYEVRDHMAVPGVRGAIDFRDHGADNNNDYWLGRATVHLGYTPCTWLNAYVEGRDSWSSSDERIPNLENNRIDLHQLFVQMGDLKQFPVTLKVGRQELAYGDQRLIGPLDWSNIGRVFDAVKVHYVHEGSWIDGFVSRPVVPEADGVDGVNPDNWFWGVYSSTRDLIPLQETQLYFLGNNANAGSPTSVSQPLFPLSTPQDVYTVGLRMASLPGKLRGWNYGLELAGQFGNFAETAVSPRLDQQAFAAHVEGGYTFEKCSLKPQVSIGYNYSTGDSNPLDDKHQTFNNLFPTNHKYYGFMDLFSWQNMQNPYVGLSVKPAKGLVLTLDYQLFWLANTADYFYQVNGVARRGGVPPGTGYSRDQGYDSHVGSELDVVASYTWKFINAQVGYGHFFVGQYVQQSLASPAFGATDANWFYAQASVNF